MTQLSGMLARNFILEGLLGDVLKGLPERIRSLSRVLEREISKEVLRRQDMLFKRYGDYFCPPPGHFACALPKDLSEFNGCGAQSSSILLPPLVSYCPDIGYHVRLRMKQQC